MTRRDLASLAAAGGAACIPQGTARAASTYASALDGLESKVDVKAFDPVAFSHRLYDAVPLRMTFRAESRKQAEFLLEKVGLKAFRKKYPPQLSGGMQRRAELARAMINNPDVMILDEPFRGLDAMSKELMWEYYAGLFEESHRTNFFVTTDIDEAIFLADRLIVMTNTPTKVRATLEVKIGRAHV